MWGRQSFDETGDALYTRSIISTGKGWHIIMVTFFIFQSVKFWLCTILTIVQYIFLFKQEGLVHDRFGPHRELVRDVLKNRETLCLTLS